MRCCGSSKSGIGAHRSRRWRLRRDAVMASSPLWLRHMHGDMVGRHEGHMRQADGPPCAPTNRRLRTAALGLLQEPAATLRASPAAACGLCLPWSVLSSEDFPAPAQHAAGDGENEQQGQPVLGEPFKKCHGFLPSLCRCRGRAPRNARRPQKPWRSFPARSLASSSDRLP